MANQSIWPWSQWLVHGREHSQAQPIRALPRTLESLGQRPSFPCFKLPRGWSRERPFLPQSVESLPENETNSTEERRAEACGEIDFWQCLSTWIQLYLKLALGHFSVIEQKHVQLPVLTLFGYNFMSFNLIVETFSFPYSKKFKFLTHTPINPKTINIHISVSPLILISLCV